MNREVFSTPSRQGQKVFASLREIFKGKFDTFLSDWYIPSSIFRDNELVENPS